MDVIMPQLGETVAEGTVTKWHKKVGDAIKADEALFDVETDKVSTEIPAQANGVLAEILIAEGATAKVGAKLAVIRESAPRSAMGAAPASTAAPITVPGAAAPDSLARTESREPVRLAVRPGVPNRLSPVVRKLLAEHTLDPSQITGSGREGRITREDVLAHIERRGAAPPAARTQERAPYVTSSPDTETVPLNVVRKRTAEHMAKSWTTIPHVLQVVEADFSKVDQARRAAGAQWKSREGWSLTYLPFIAHAVVAALAQFPRLNASFNGDHIAVHKRFNLGIAVDLNFDGLLVPVVKDAAGRSLTQLARASTTSPRGRARAISSPTT